VTAQADAGKDWLKLHLIADAERASELSELLESAGAEAVSLADAGETPIYEPAPGTEPLWPSTRVTGLFAGRTEIERALALIGRALAPEPVPAHAVEALAARAWADAWRSGYRPMRFGRRLWVSPPGERTPADAAVVEMEPGLAFGTGTHPTTALMLEHLASRSLAGAEVVDYGCGSGILAIAALRLGARRAWALDIDPQALSATRANAARNGVAHAVETREPSLCTVRGAHLVLANILARPLIELAPRLAGMLRPGGTLALSGVLEAQAQSVLAAYRPWFVFAPAAAREGWVRLAGRRSG